MLVNPGEIKELNIGLNPYTPPPDGSMTVDVLDMWWEDPTDPKLGGVEHPFMVRFRNNSAQSCRVTFGAWWANWWSEGGWDHEDLGPFEIKDCHNTCLIPAEQWYDYRAQLIYIVNFESGYHYEPGNQGWTKYGLSCDIYQNPDTLIPYGSPQLYTPWSGIKSFPVPSSAQTKGFYFESIELPMPGSADEGRVVVRLVSPAHCDEFGMVGFATGEMRYTVSDISKVSYDSFSYRITILNKDLRASLTRADPSGVFEFPISLKDIGSGLHMIDVYIRVNYIKSSGERGSFVLWFFPTQKCLKPVIGMLNRS